MIPRDLKPEDFIGYSPEARKLVTNFLSALQPLPLSFVPNLLREAIDYDFKFPAERLALEKELENLRTLSPAQRSDWMRNFSSLSISSQLEHMDWVNSPAQFVEQLSTHLWATHQLDAFRNAATEYADRLHAALPPQPPPIPRLGIVVIGQGTSAYDEPLFRKLRPHGGYFTGIKPDRGLRILFDAVVARADAHPIPYGHWYVDGGAEADFFPSLTQVSYQALEPVRTALLRKMREEIEKPGMGPEVLRTRLALMNPSDVGFNAEGDPVLDRFQLKLLTEGSGTQIFSTTFVQWAAREALRRAQPCTLLVRYAQRQRQKPMNELISDKGDESELDPHGSLMDADMGAYYQWINQQRLAGADQSSFLVWYEGRNEAIAIGPAMPRGTESASAMTLRDLLAMIT